MHGLCTTDDVTPSADTPVSLADEEQGSRGASERPEARQCNNRRLSPGSFTAGREPRPNQTDWETFIKGPAGKCVLITAGARGISYAVIMARLGEGFRVIALPSDVADEAAGPRLSPATTPPTSPVERCPWRAASLPTTTSSPTGPPEVTRPLTDQTNTGLTAVNTGRDGRGRPVSVRRRNSTPGPAPATVLARCDSQQSRGHGTPAP